MVHPSELRVMREDLGVTQQAVATDLRVRVCNLSRYERGNSPMPAHIYREYIESLARYADAREKAIARARELASRLEAEPVAGPSLRAGRPLSLLAAV